MPLQTAMTVESTIPVNSNKKMTVYFIRHAEAHPTSYWEDGNLVYLGDVRALYLPIALEGKITRPDFVYAVDQAQSSRAALTATIQALPITLTSGPPRPLLRM